MKIFFLLEYYDHSGDFIRQIRTLIGSDNNQQSDESLSNVKPVDVYFGRNKGVKENRKRSRNGHMFYHINAPEPPMPNPHLSPILYEGGLLAR